MFVTLLYLTLLCSLSLVQLGAESVSAQVGSVLLLFLFYLSDFQLAGYIPKPAFSSMLVLSFLDMSYTWFYKSYFKIKDKTEWLVCPAIVVAAFTLDLLTAVFVGVALSTFIFVASFFKSGVVKYAANGQVIHSTIDRSFKKGEWLNENGDLIQILVLQNYLFFGNATSVYTYIGTMFENRDEDGEEQPSTELARVPTFVILDLTLVTGMDTSTVDVFADIKNLCASQNCRLLMAGMAPGLRATLALSGVKPDTGDRSTRQLRFFASLDTALGKAEDNLLESEFPEKEIPSITARQQRLNQGDHGFRTALRHIDEEVRDPTLFNHLCILNPC
jgi:MFS superfamily sulfate permease-like transporter